MSIYRQRDGLFWLSLFSIQNEKEKKILLKRIKENHIDYTANWLALKMLEISGMDYNEYRADDPCMEIACERVALKFMLCDSDLAKDLLTEEELTKANEVYARKQYNSKILQKLLNNFLYLLIDNYSTVKPKNLFTISIIDELRKVREDEINRTYGALKKAIEKIASGVKPNCYYEAEHTLHFFYNLNDSLNQFVISKTNYDYNKILERRASNDSSTLLHNYDGKINNSILQLALVNDSDFWSKHEQFNVITFINEIAKQNDIRHAEKILEFIFENLQKMPNMSIVFNNNFPLFMSKYDELVDALEEQGFRFSFKRLEHYCDLSPIKSIRICYPMSKSEPAYFEIGKKLWTRFICEYNYPNNYELVNNYISNEVNRFVSGETHEYNDIAVILDCGPFCFSADDEDRRLFSAYHPDCFSAENIWKRVYLKAYAITLLSSDENKQFSYMQRIFIDLIKAIERRIGICTVHQLDTSAREKHYEQLKSILSSYNIKVNDSNKNDYIIALLDRDTALIEEVGHFPILEQIGDAIYGLAVAELLFYDPETEKMPESFESFTRAEAQVLISKKLGFNELYLQTGLPAKYIEFDSLFFDYDTFDEEHLQALNQEKYLADSLEMIIGAVYRDMGIEKALNFAKSLLLNTFPDKLHKEVHPTDETKHNTDIDMDYWSRILPSPCSVMNNEHHTLWDALNKVILIDSLGTDDKDKRKYITKSFGNTAIYNETHNYGISWAFHDYLNNGLTSVLEHYGETIRNNYNNNKKI